jgi:hypothetical protein
MRSELHMNTKLMESDEASDYTRIAENYLLNQAKQGNITYILTSPKKIMFDKADLDTWMAGWRRIEATVRN